MLKTGFALTSLALASAQTTTQAGYEPLLCDDSVSSSQGLHNSDTNVAFVSGYYGLPDPTVSMADGIQALPWSYPLDKCTMVQASAESYWKYTCMDDGDWVLAENFATDSTCMGTSFGNHTIDNTTGLAYNCGAGTTEAWFRAQMYIGSCQDDEDDAKNSYGVVGEGQCELTLLPAENDESSPGFANFYCDKEGLVLNSYQFSGSACAGTLCQQGSIDEGECEFLISAVVGGAAISINARQLQCMSAEADQCRDGSTGDCESAAPNTAATAVAAAVALALAAKML